MNQREWLEWRFNGFGGSDAAVIMNLFPYGKTPYMLWKEKVHRIVNEENIAMSHGKIHEDAALNWFENKMQVALWRQTPLVDEEYPWMRATIDGIDSSGKYMVEAKVPYNLENHSRIRFHKKIPPIYYPQCQQQMRVNKKDKMYFLSYNWKEPNDSIILEVLREPSYIYKLIENSKVLWDQVIKKTSPPLTEFDYMDMNGNTEWIKLSSEYREIDEQEKLIKKRKEEIKRDLIEISDGKNAEGNGIQLQKQTRKGFVDYDRIPELKNVNLDDYRKESFTQWPIRVTKK